MKLVSTNKLFPLKRKVMSPFEEGTRYEIEAFRSRM